jgi:protocatechuate 3,4-dioxygenase beta subunit
MIRMMGGLSLAGLLAACGLGGTAESTTTLAPGTSSGGPATVDSTSPTTTESGAATTAPAGAEIPDETAGPFPADGSNGPNVLDDEGIVRADITSSVGGSSGVAEGVPMAINLSIVDASNGSPIPGAVVYLWHCTADGRYSIYEISEENYLRGVQVADDAGRVQFASIFPGCYDGRWPHAHFEVYGSLQDATAGATPIKTSQLALPQADCETVYADGRYGDSSQNLSRLSLDTDGVFRDGWTDQLATVAGSVAEGYTASLLVRT